MTPAQEPPDPSHGVPEQRGDEGADIFSLPPHPSPLHWLAIVLLLLADIAAYANSTAGAFILDDLPGIVHNPALRSWNELPGLLTTSRPLVELSLRINYAIADALGNGLNPVGYHVFNIIIHLLAGLTLFGIVRRTLQYKGPRNLGTKGPSTLPLGPSVPRSLGPSLLAFAVALLWMVHPLTTAAVTYVIQRATSMMALFFLLALYCVIRAAHAPHAAPEERSDEGPGSHAPRSTLHALRSSPLLWYAAAVLCAAASMASKQVAAVLPFVLLLYDRAFLAGSFLQAIRKRWLIYILLLLGTAALVWTAFRPVGMAGYQSAGFGATHRTVLQYAATQPSVILHYLRLSVWPHPLVLDYDWQPAATLWAIVPPAVVLGILVLAALLALWRAPKVGFVAASFFIVLAPTSSIMPIADMAFEQRMYLPLAAVVTLLVLAAAWVLRKGAEVLGLGSRGAWRLAAVGLLMAVAAAFIVLTVRRNADYDTQVSIWRDTIRKVPHNSRAHDNLGAVLASLGRDEEAVVQYHQALKIEPGNAYARVNLGLSLLNLGRTADAARQFTTTLHYWHEYAPALYQLGILASKAHRYEQAEQYYRRALKQNPALAGAYERLGNIYLNTNRLDQAIQAYRAAIRHGENSARLHNNLGRALAMQGHIREAVKQFALAVRIDPDFTDARANLAHARQMLPHP